MSCGQARAAEVTRVVSGSRGVGEMFDFNLSLAWTHDQRTARVTRETEGQATGGQIRIAKELTARQTRDVLHLRADFGVYKDLSFFAVTPLVLADNRSLDFDRAEGCGGTSPPPSCVDERNATILRDGILPGFGMPSFGLDAEHGRAFVSPSGTVFRGPTRRGLEYLGLGASWAVFNQARDDTKPTWLVRFESRLAVAPDQRFDPIKPKSNRGVGPGYHQFVLSTIFSRRFDVLEPYLGGWYMLPYAPDGSPYKRYVLGRNAYGQPQHRAGAEFGVEARAWEDARARQRVHFELRGRMEVRFFGLAQSPLWEPLSGASTCPMERITCRAEIDRDLTRDGVPDPNPGITRSPSYGVFGGDAGVSIQIGKYARFRGLYGMTFEQDRFITDARSGNEAYDNPGRRFRVEDAQSWHLLIEGGLLF